MEINVPPPKMKAKVKAKKEVAKGTLLVEYDLLGQNVDFKPGQIFHVTLLGKFTHHFTVTNSPNRKGIISHITRIRDTDFKKTLNNLSIGDDVEIYKIKGEFILPDDTSKPLVFIALGIGITPYLSMLSYIKEESLNYKITLIYSDSDKESLVYLPFLENLSKNSPNFKLILTITQDPSWLGEKKHIDEKFIQEYLKNPKDYFYFISGPPKAVEAVNTSLANIGIDHVYIKTENFKGYE